MTSPAPPLDRRRISGIDVARFVAIIGMMAAHLTVSLGSAPHASALDRLAGKVIGATVSSTSATAFAVLGGISLVLLARSISSASTGALMLSILLRGSLISLIGLLLEQLDSPISIVLTAYGAAMILAAPTLLLRTPAVAAIAGVLWLFGGALNARVRMGLLDVPGSTFDEYITVKLRDIVLTGHYPAITWVAYMLTGIVIARAMLSADRAGLRRLCIRLTVIGLGVYTVITVASRVARVRPAWFGLPDMGEIMLDSGRGAPIGTDFWMLLMPTPHSGSPGDMLRTVAGACMIIGVLVLLFDVRPAVRGFTLEMIRCAGAAPLTVYTAHVCVTAQLQVMATKAELAGAATAPVWYAQGLSALALQLIGVLVLGAVLAQLRKRGPLEALLSWASGINAWRRRTSGHSTVNAAPLH